MTRCPVFRTRRLVSSIVFRVTRDKRRLAPEYRTLGVDTCDERERAQLSGEPSFDRRPFDPSVEISDLLGENESERKKKNNNNSNKTCGREMEKGERKNEGEVKSK